MKNLIKVLKHNIKQRLRLFLELDISSYSKMRLKEFEDLLQRDVDTLAIGERVRLKILIEDFDKVPDCTHSIVHASYTKLYMKII